MVSNPAVEAAQKAWLARYHGSQMEISVEQSAGNGGVGALAVDAAREALKPIKDQMVVAKARYSELQDLMLAGATSAETSRYANEMAGIHYLYRLIAPLVYSSEELS